MMKTEDWIRLTKCHDAMGFQEKLLAAETSVAFGFLSESPVFVQNVGFRIQVILIQKKCVQFY